MPRELPPRPNLDQLKRQAKELLDSWRITPSLAPSGPRLRDAQRAIAEQYGFASWDALRDHVQQLATPPVTHRGLVYDDPLPNVVNLRGALTDAVIRRLIDERASGVKVDATIEPSALAQLARVPTIERLDLSDRDDLVDRDVEFLRHMTQLTAVSFFRCRQIGDGAVAMLSAHERLEQVNLQWSAAGDAAIAALAGKPRLQRLSVGNRTTDRGAALLPDLPALRTARGVDTFLSISGARELTDAALAFIGDLDGVAALDVHMSAFGSPHYTARGAAHLARMSSLSELNFHGQLVTDDVLVQLARIPNLRSLHAQDIASGDAGFIALGQCVSLEGLGSRLCARVGDRGVGALAALPRLVRLSIGGPRLSDDALAPLADRGLLTDLNPILSRDPAFAHIGRMSRLERLTNMYNRATTDQATRHLASHARLVHYGAFGTQIGDASLLMLAALPRLESVELENCAGITDEGLRALLRAPRLRRLSAWSCMQVTGAWTSEAPAHVTVQSESGPAGHVNMYRAETLMDYPDMPMPDEFYPPRGDAPAAGALAELRQITDVARFTTDGLELHVPEDGDLRNAGVMTRDAMVAPVRIELVVSPLDGIRIVFGRHNRHLAFDDHGRVVDLAPWFMRTAAERGVAHGGSDIQPLGDGPVRITMDVDARQQRLSVNGSLRHSWDGDFTGLRSRIAIGLRKPRAIVHAMSVTPL